MQEDVKEAILRFARDNERATVTSISRHLGLPWADIKRVLEEGGIDWRARSNFGRTPRNRERELEILRLKDEEGWSLNEIATHFEISRTRVYTVYHRAKAEAKRAEEPA